MSPGRHDVFAVAVESHYTGPRLFLIVGKEQCLCHARGGVGVLSVAPAPCDVQRKHGMPFQKRQRQQSIPTMLRRLIGWASSRTWVPVAPTFQQRCRTVVNCARGVSVCACRQLSRLAPSAASHRPGYANCCAPLSTRPACTRMGAGWRPHEKRFLARIFHSPPDDRQRHGPKARLTTGVALDTAIRPIP